MLLPASASAIRGPTPFTYCTGVESSTMGEDCAPRRYWRDGIERISGARQPPCTHLRSGSRPPTTAEGELVSKSSVLMNFLQALASILLGNLVYFSLYSSLPPLARHQPRQLDLGMVIDFWFCLVAYGLIRTARKWR